MFLLTLPTVLSMILAVVFSTIFSVALYFIIHPFWSRELTEDTKKTADNVAMRIGVVYAVVIGMMFANVRIEHAQMVQSIESEASALARLYHALERDEGDSGNDIKRKIFDYIHFIVDEQWPALREARVQPGDQTIAGRDQLEPIWNYVVESEDGAKTSNLYALLNEVEHYRTLRLFDAKGNLLPIFWYIAIFGYIASLIPLYVYAPTLRRCCLISLYSGMVSVVLLGIFILSHPYSVAAGVEPDIFNWLLETPPSKELRK